MTEKSAVAVPNPRSSRSRPGPCPPVTVVGDRVSYYAVDHTPSYLWNSATWVNSEAILPHLRTVMTGPQAWAKETTIDRAIEIQDGQIRNPAILSFQGREDSYPYVQANADSSGGADTA